MSEHSTVSTASGPDFNLPDEILSVIPADPYDQLDLARKITSMALASRVSKLEAEAGRLRHKLSEKDRVIVELEEKVDELKQTCHNVQLRMQITVEDNVNWCLGLLILLIIVVFFFLNFGLMFFLFVNEEEAYGGERFVGDDC